MIQEEVIEEPIAQSLEKTPEVVEEDSESLAPSAKLQKTD